MGCSHVVEDGNEEIHKFIDNKVRVNEIPINGTIEITHRCNLKCIHCYLPPVNYQEAIDKELSYEEICNIIDQIVQEGCLWLYISGGEPLIRNDFLDIFTHAKEKGLVVIIATNGTLITPKIANYLQEWNNYSLEISLYGITKETYEKVTGILGSFEQCMKGINILTERSIPFLLRTPLMTINEHEILKIKKYAGCMGIDFGFDSIIYPMVNGSKKPCKLRVSEKDAVKLELEIYGDVKKMGYKKNNQLFNCNAGEIAFRIDPYGKLILCSLFRFPNYNLRDGSFKEGWNFLHKIRTQKPPDSYKCKNCEKVIFCDTCPALSQLENQNLYDPVEYACQIAHIRAEMSKNM